ncbi:hypothetical protein LCGC14_1549240 [marine sediment metagenome]|uniref:Uncharacterized protein n=1 Tax=marine sediment metagenome TaxID=412755 RepID=A0A0F9IQT1_9ZZZZ
MKRLIETWADLLAPYQPIQYKKIVPKYCGNCNTDLQVKDVLKNLCRFCYSGV